MNYTDHQKLIIPIRYWLIGMANFDTHYNLVLRALEFFADIHKDEIRKNGARGFYHQLSILSYVRNFHTLLPDPVAVYITILGHDAVEDYPQCEDAVRENFPDHFQYLRRMSKFSNGMKLNNDAYYNNLAQCPICVIAKAGDRINNLSTMSDRGAFSIEKQKRYVTETMEYVLPLLKTARRRFPEIEPLCEVFKSTLLIQCQITNNLIERVEQVKSSTFDYDETEVEILTMAVLGKERDDVPGINWQCNRQWKVDDVRALVRDGLKRIQEKRDQK
jgi:hypothetical protein